MTRGIRNNNPLNIRKVPGTHWRGELPSPEGNCSLAAKQLGSESDGGQAGDRLFVQFESIEYGLRAAFCLLETYRRKYKAVCVEDIINRWAPPSENDTRKYVETVCKLTGFGGKERLVEDQLPALVHAMAFVECGALISKETIEQGYNLYVKLKSNSK